MKQRTMLIRVKKKHFASNATRKQILTAAIKEAMFCDEVGYATEDQPPWDNYRTVACCSRKDNRLPDGSRSKMGRGMYRELLLPKAADDFLVGKPNTFKPFKFYVPVGCFA